MKKEILDQFTIDLKNIEKMSNIVEMKELINDWKETFKENGVTTKEIIQHGLGGEEKNILKAILVFEIASNIEKKLPINLDEILNKHEINDSLKHEIKTDFKNINFQEKNLEKGIIAKVFNEIKGYVAAIILVVAVAIPLNEKLKTKVENQVEKASVLYETNFKASEILTMLQDSYENDTTEKHIDTLAKYKDVLSSDKFMTSEYAEAVFASRLNMESKADVIDIIVKNSELSKLDTANMEKSPILNKIMEVNFDKNNIFDQKEKNIICKSMILSIDVKDMEKKDENGNNLLATLYKENSNTLPLYKNAISTIETTMDIKLEKKDIQNLFCQKGKIDEKLIKDLGDDINDIFKNNGKETTLLIEAIKEGNVDKVSVLMENKADIKIELSDGTTAIDALNKTKEENLESEQQCNGSEAEESIDTRYKDIAYNLDLIEEKINNESDKKSEKVVAEKN